MDNLFCEYYKSVNSVVSRIIKFNVTATYGFLINSKCLIITNLFQIILIIYIIYKIFKNL